jgi:hypothetical protein
MNRSERRREKRMLKGLNICALPRKPRDRFGNVIDPLAKITQAVKMGE